MVDQISVRFFDQGTPLTDFDYNGGCQDQMDIQEVPEGDLQMEVIGYDASSVATYCGMFDIKVGAGITNPIFTWDVTHDATQCAAVQ